MITITCKCGANTYSFQHLGEKDFPEGLTQSCCTGALGDAPRIEPGSPELVLGFSEMSLADVMAQLPVTNELPDLSEEAVEEIAEEVAQQDPWVKRKGRKPKA